MADPFAVKDCALIAIATGEHAQNLREMRDHLLTVHPGCIYHHFWGGMLQPRFDEPEYMNDFAAWAWRGLHDPGLAERLALIDPTHYRDLEELRRELLEVIEERLDETEMVPWSRTGQAFHFIRSRIVVFDTRIRISHPRELRDRIGQLPLGSVFYHFVDARRRAPIGKNDFSAWLMSLDGDWSELAEILGNVDPYFTTLAELRREFEEVLKAYAV
ncbi:MAG TPA: DUF5752 family protein [Syntrophobacteraceae bacterium]|nr:DUF5752 family protein [Syntrophobacteraceae bacterium]